MDNSHVSLVSVSLRADGFDKFRWRTSVADPVSGAFLTPGSGMGKKVRIRIQDPWWTTQPGSYFLELRNHFFGLKYLNSLMRIRDGKIRIRALGWKKVGSGINIPDPQYFDEPYKIFLHCAHITFVILIAVLRIRIRIWFGPPGTEFKYTIMSFYSPFNNSKLSNCIPTK